MKLSELKKKILELETPGEDPEVLIVNIEGIPSSIQAVTKSHGQLKLHIIL